MHSIHRKFSTSPSAQPKPWPPRFSACPSPQAFPIQLNNLYWLLATESGTPTASYGLRGRGGLVVVFIRNFDAPVRRSALARAFDKNKFWQPDELLRPLQIQQRYIRMSSMRAVWAAPWFQLIMAPLRCPKPTQGFYSKPARPALH